MSDSPLFCDRCLVELFPGRGDFYVVNINAVADPSPPQFSKEHLDRDLRSEINQLIRKMEDLSAQEAIDQVRRRMTLHLCRRCFDHWIEDPVADRSPKET